MISAGPGVLRRAIGLRRRLASALYPLCLFAAVIATWELSTRLGYVKSFELPSASRVFMTIWAHPAAPLGDTWVSAKEALVGLAFAICVGVALALLIASAKIIERALYPFAVVVNTIPVIAVFPMMSIWFGFGLLPKVLIVIYLTFFPIMINTLAGLRSTSQSHIDLSRSMGAGWLMSAVKIRLPVALPHFLSGLRIAATFAIIGSFVAELFGPHGGLGAGIIAAYGNLELPRMMEYIIYLSILGYAFFSAVGALERILIPWHESQRQTSPRVGSL